MSRKKFPTICRRVLPKSFFWGNSHRLILDEAFFKIHIIFAGKMLPAINSFKICHNFVSGEDSDDVQILAALVGGKLFFASSFYVSAELWPRNVLQYLRPFSSKLQRTAAVLEITTLCSGKIRSS